jgi:hypothetical protein
MGTLIYTVESTDFNGVNTLIEIHDRDANVESPRSLTPTDNYLVYHLPDGTDIMEPIQGSGCTINAIGNDDDNLRQLFTSDVRRFPVYVKKDGIRVFSGYVTTEIYTEDYSDTRFEINIECNDGLAILKRLDFGRDVTELSNLRDLVEDCCVAIGVTKVHTYFTLFRDALTGSDNVELDTLSLRNYNFYDEQFEPESLYFVLAEFCRALDLIVYRKADILYIVNPIQLTESTITERVYIITTGNLVKVSEQAYTNTTAVVDTDMYWGTTTQKLDILPAFNSLKLELSGHADSEYTPYPDWSSKDDESSAYLEPDPATRVEFISTVNYEDHSRNEYSFSSLPQKITGWERNSGYSFWCITESGEGKSEDEKYEDRKFDFWVKLAPTTTQTFFGVFNFRNVRGDLTPAYSKEIDLESFRFDSGFTTSQAYKLTGVFRVNYLEEFYYYSTPPELLTAAPVFRLTLLDKTTDAVMGYWGYKTTDTNVLYPKFYDNTSNNVIMFPVVSKEEGALTITEQDINFEFIIPSFEYNWRIEIMDMVVGRGDTMVGDRDLINRMQTLAIKDISIVPWDLNKEQIPRNDISFTVALAPSFKSEAPTISLKVGDATRYAETDDGSIAFKSALMLTDYPGRLAGNFYLPVNPTDITSLNELVSKQYISQFQSPRFNLTGSFVRVAGVTEDLIWGVDSVLNKTTLITDANLPNKKFYLKSGNYSDSTGVCNVDLLEIHANNIT